MRGGYDVCLLGNGVLVLRMTVVVAEGVTVTVTGAAEMVLVA